MLSVFLCVSSLSRVTKPEWPASTLWDRLSSRCGRQRATQAWLCSRCGQTSRSPCLGPFRPSARVLLRCDDLLFRETVADSSQICVLNKKTTTKKQKLLIPGSLKLQIHEDQHWVTNGTGLITRFLFCQLWSFGLPTPSRRINATLE